MYHNPRVHVHDVRSLLGMANYSSKYIPDFATITAPLRASTKKNTQFEWTQIYQTSFDKLTTALTSAPCMSYFDKAKETFVVVDASPVGISAILSQKSRRWESDCRSLCQPRIDCHRDALFTNRKRGSGDRLVSWTLSFILVWKWVYPGDWS